MPIHPKALLIIFGASVTKEVVGFAVQIPEALLEVAKQRALNYGIQYGTVAISLSRARVLVELDGPAKLLQQGFATMAAASSPEEAAGQGALAASALILAGVSGADAETSMAYGAFLALLCKNILLSQGVLAPSLVTSYTIIYIMKNVIWRLVLEIQISLINKSMDSNKRTDKKIIRNIININF